MAKAAVFVDTSSGASVEAGDIHRPLEAGVLVADQVSEFADLCRLS